MTPWAQVIVTIFGAFGAALGGAWVAFALESKRKEKAERSGWAQGGNRILMDLYRTWNELRQYQTEVIEPFTTEGRAPWFMMPSTPVEAPQSDFLDISRLEYLLETKPEVVADVMLQRRRFGLVCWMIDRRSHLMTQRAFPKLEAAGIRHGEEVTLERMEQILGISLFSLIRDIAQNILNFVPEDVESAEGCFNSLRSELVVMLPEHTFVQMDQEKPPPDKS